MIRMFYPQTADRLLPVLAILTAVVLWGGSFAATRIALIHLSPLSVMAVRMGIAFCVITPFAPKLLPPQPIAGDLRYLLPMVAFQPCLYFLFESHALQYTTSSQAGVISACFPLMVTAGAALFFKEKVTGKTLSGLALSVFGVVALTLAGTGDAMATAPLLGNVLEVCAMACAASNVLLVKQLSDRYSPWTLTACQVVAGTLFFLPGFIPLWQKGAAIRQPELVLSLVFLGGLVTLCAFGLYNWAISKIPASRASAFVNLVPVCAVAIGWSLLGESLTLVQCGAGFLVILGVWLSEKRDDAQE